LKPNGAAGELVGFGNNSAWAESGNCFALFDRNGPGARSWVLPPEVDGSVYWPGGSVAVGARLYVFMARVFVDKAHPFGRAVGAAVASFDLPSLQLARVTEIPFIRNRVYGAGAVADGGYIYAYASQARTCALCFANDMYIARVPENQIANPNAWQFRAGAAWITNPHAATPVLPAAVSNTDVQHYGNGFLLITKTLGIVSDVVEAWFAPTPAGPWADLGTVFHVPQPVSHVAGYHLQSPYTYNPVVLSTQQMQDGGFLAVYNVSTLATADAEHDGLLVGPRFVSIHLPPPPSAPVRAGYTAGPSPWTPTFGADRVGRVYTIDGGVGSTVARTNSTVAVARTPDARGAWVATADGHVYTVGDAVSYGSMAGKHLNQAMVGMAATPTGHGYWLVATDGGIFGFGDAVFRGSTGGIRLNQPIFAMASSPSGRGYWLVASDGGVFAFGDVGFYGSAGGMHLQVPVSGMAATPDGRGYWLVTVLGEVYTFGDAVYAGNAPLPMAAYSIGIVPAPGGYRIVDALGNVFRRGATNGQSRISAASLIVAAG
jgi:hypothetical protein